MTLPMESRQTPINKLLHTGLENESGFGPEHAFCNLQCHSSIICYVPINMYIVTRSLWFDAMFNRGWTILSMLDSYLILLSHPCSSVSSMTRSTQAPAATNLSTISKSSWRLTANGDHRAQPSTWWKLLQWTAWSLPLARRAAVTVRGPHANKVPVSSVIKFLPVGAVKSGRKTVKISIMGSGSGLPCPCGTPPPMKLGISEKVELLGLDKTVLLLYNIDNTDVSCWDQYLTKSLWEGLTS